MGIENNTREIEIQNQELQRANKEQIEQANKEHEELGKVLDGVDTLDNEAELDEISGNEDISEQDDAASQLDNNDKIEDETSEQFETINNPVYNEVENNGFSINDVNQAVDAKEAYEAEIRDMSQDEYHDQKELDQRVEENGSEPNMTEPSVLGNDLHQGDVSNKETDNRSRLNEVERNPDASFKKDEADTVNLNEIRSKFDSENFTVEKSYDVCASKETRELAAKGNSELVPMGEDTNNHPEAKELYSESDVAKLKAERDKIENPENNTVMQKVLCPDTGNINEDLDRYLNPKNRDGKEIDAQVYGFVSKAEDSSPFTRTPEECYNNLRLDYKGTNYIDPQQAVYIMRYTDGTNYEIPYGKQFEGNCEDGVPCTGNGYTGSSNYMIPEYKVKPIGNGQGAIVTDGVIYRISPNGPETAVAEFDEDYKKFVLCK